MATSAQEIHRNSRAAFHQESASTFPNRREQIIEALRKHGKQASDRELMVLCGYSDMNSVRPRITELVKDGTLYESFETLDVTTGKRCRQVWFNEARKQAALFQMPASAASYPD